MMLSLSSAMLFLRSGAGKIIAGAVAVMATLAVILRVDRKNQALKAKNKDIKEALRIRREADAARNAIHTGDGVDLDAERLRDRINKNLGR